MESLESTPTVDKFLYRIIKIFKRIRLGCPLQFVVTTCDLELKLTYLHDQTHTMRPGHRGSQHDVTGLHFGVCTCALARQTDRREQCTHLLSLPKQHNHMSCYEHMSMETCIQHSSPHSYPHATTSVSSLEVRCWQGFWAMCSASQILVGRGD